MKTSGAQDPIPGGQSCLLGCVQTPVPALGPGQGSLAPPEGGEGFSAGPALWTDSQTRSQPAAVTRSPSLLVTECLRGEANTAGDVVTAPTRGPDGWNSQQPQPCGLEDKRLLFQTSGSVKLLQPAGITARRITRNQFLQRRKKQLARAPGGPSAQGNVRSLAGRLQVATALGMREEPEIQSAMNPATAGRFADRSLTLVMQPLHLLGPFFLSRHNQGEIIVHPDTESSQDCQREDGRIERTREGPATRGRHPPWSENVMRSPKSEKSGSILFQGTIYKD